MTERPILFNSEMVRAVLEGRKTVTRRLMKPQPNGIPWLLLREDGWYWAEGEADRIDTATLTKCPYSADQLWVQEAWSHDAAHGRTLYEADADLDGTVPYLDNGAGGFGGGVCHATVDLWRQPDDMPRWASRITLAVEGIRVERVRDITPEDALAEGIQMRGYSTAAPFNAVHDFQALWDSINGKRPGCAWADDPWVWVVRFSVTEGGKA